MEAASRRARDEGHRRWPAILAVTAVFCGVTASSVGTSGPAGAAVTRTYDLSQCDGGRGIWSWRVDGSVDRWAFAPDEAARYVMMLVPDLGAASDPGSPDFDPANNAHFELRGDLPDARYWSVASYSGGSVLDSRLDRAIVSNQSSYRVSLNSASGPVTPAPNNPNPVRVGFDLDGKPQARTPVVLRTYLEAGPPRTPRLVYVVTGRPSGLPATLAGACRLFRGDPDALGGQLDDYASCRHERARDIASAGRAAVEGWHPRPPEGWFLDGMEEVDPWSPHPADACALREAPAARTGVFPNPDNAYLVNYLDPVAVDDTAFVMRFRLPTVGDGGQVRYLSVCDYQMDNGGYAIGGSAFEPPTTSGCLDDSELVVDDQGWVVVVVSAQRPPGVANWIPMASDAPMVLIRYLVAGPGFSEYPGAYDPGLGTLAEHMGQYFPTSTYCRALDLGAGGDCGLAARP